MHMLKAEQRKYKSCPAQAVRTYFHVRKRSRPNACSYAVMQGSTGYARLPFPTPALSLVLTNTKTSICILERISSCLLKDFAPVTFASFSSIINLHSLLNQSLEHIKMLYYLSFKKQSLTLTTLSSYRPIFAFSPHLLLSPLQLCFHHPYST